MRKLFLLLLICFIPLQAQDRWEQIINLSGNWKFELGDDMDWSREGFDDSRWDNIYVPSTWEDEGFPGYDGFAWYRITFTLKGLKLPEEPTVYLRLGNIDDCDEAYINGVFINRSGEFPPYVQTAYNQERIYAIPRSVLNLNGKNTLAVRVYDTHLDGGIVDGPVGLFFDRNELIPDLRLDGVWAFRIGDRPHYADPSLDDSGWDKIHVPGFWEKEGYQDYDGYGWYRTQFRVPRYIRDQRLILLLGKIDDLDEVYINGERIGRTGFMYDDPRYNEFDDEYARQRVYTISNDVLNLDGPNVLAVRVYDGYLDGGIYEGPIGLITREHYLDWRNRTGKNVSIFERIFDSFRHEQ